MSFFKDLYLDEVVRLAAELEDEGVAPDEAYEIASERAYDSARDRLFDAADRARKQAKEDKQ